VTWLRLDDGMVDHPKIEALSDRAFRAYHRLLSAAARFQSDGRVTRALLQRINGATRAHVAPTAELIRQGLLSVDENGDGWLHDFLEYNPSKQQVLRRREHDAKRQQRLRSRRDTPRDEKSMSRRDSAGPDPAPISVVQKNGSSGSSSSHLRDISFNAFYEAFPRHQGKGAARKSYERARGKTDEAAILAGAERYRDDPNRDAEFTCLPATWLNQERWGDDPLPWRAGNGQPPKATTAEPFDPDWMFKPVPRSSADD
jgi:hypothetical protein